MSYNKDVAIACLITVFPKSSQSKEFISITRSSLNEQGRVQELKRKEKGEKKGLGVGKLLVLKHHNTRHSGHMVQSLSK